MLFCEKPKYFFNPLLRRLFPVVLFFLFIFSGYSQQTFLGEKLTYSVNYGWIKIGEAEIFIDPELKYINDQPHYQIQSLVKTSSFVGFFKSIDYCYESLINVNTGAPLISNRILKTGDDLDVRTDEFSFGDSTEVTAYIEDIDKYRNHSFSKNKIVLDFLSTFLYFQTVDFENKKSIKINTFYSNTLYPVTLINPRKGKTKWNENNFSTSEFSLRFPKNDLFKNGKHGKVILLNNDRKTLAKIEFNMTLGKINFELERIEKNDL